MSKLLYYPYMSIPNESWLIQALLYWDGIATIVPVNILEHPSHFTPFARKLVQEGIIDTILPEEYAFSCPDYYLQFLKWVEKNASHFSLNSNEKCIVIPSQDYVHAGKLGYIGAELEEMGLAKQMSGQWYAMNSRLSNSFMTFLAMLIGKETDRIPMTNTYQGMSSFFCVDYTVASRNANAVKSTLRNTLLNEFLPAPSLVNDLNDILRFKDRYHDELIRFRNHVEKFVASQQATPIELMDICHNSFIENSRDEIEQLIGHMGFFHAPQIDMGTLVAAIPSVLEIINENFLGAAAGLVPLLFETVWNADRRSNQKKPFAYAALFQDRFFPAKRRAVHS